MKKTNWKIKYFEQLEINKQLQKKIDLNASLFEKIMRPVVKKRSGLSIKKSNIFNTEAENVSKEKF